MKAPSITFAVAVLCLAFAGCNSDNLANTGDELASGSWGGEDVWVDAQTADVHVHVGCTSGDFPAPIALDDNGRFSVAGSYHLHLYPVAFGPSYPAQFAGVVNGNRLTFTVAVNDTVEKKLVVLGPAVVTFGRQPQMGPCPICTAEMRKARAIQRSE